MLKRTGIVELGAPQQPQVTLHASIEPQIATAPAIPAVTVIGMDITPIYTYRDATTSHIKNVAR